MRNQWRIEKTKGKAGPFHNRQIPSPALPLVAVHQVTSAALVLGSTQNADLIETEKAESAGIEVCRRRTGGGIVSLEPGRDLWVDVEIPAASRLWHQDVEKAFFWLGKAWAEALQESGIEDISMHKGPLTNATWGRIICFAGLGPGEVTATGRKVVGISQRRTKAGVRFQSLFVNSWNPEALSPYLRADLLPPEIDLPSLPIGVPTSETKLDMSHLFSNFLNKLPPPL